MQKLSQRNQATQVTIKQTVANDRKPINNPNKNMGCMCVCSAQRSLPYGYKMTYGFTQIIIRFSQILSILLLPADVPVAEDGQYPPWHFQL